MDEQSITAGLLERLMSAISEEYWCAGWMHNLEFFGTFDEFRHTSVV